MKRFTHKLLSAAAALIAAAIPFTVYAEAPAGDAANGNTVYSEVAE